MKEFYNFKVVITPESCADISEILISQHCSFKDTSLIQVNCVIDSVNQIMQDSVLRNPDVILPQADLVKADIRSAGNIYGKAAKIRENKGEVAEEYQKMSNRDATDLDGLIIDIGGKKIKLNLLEEVGEKPTIDQIIDYLKKTHQVEISPAQRNFLCTQWNQASITGAASMFYTGFPIGSVSFADRKRPSYHIFNFDNDGKLMSAQYVANVVDIADDKKTGIFTTTADISNLRGVESSEEDEWIPQHAPNNITINYRSADLACDIVPEVHEAISRHSNFKGLSSEQLPNTQMSNTDIQQCIESSVSSLEIAKILERITYIENASQDGFEKILGSIANAIDRFKDSGEDVGNIIAAIPHDRTNDNILNGIRKSMKLQKSAEDIAKIIEKLNQPSERSLYEDLIKDAIIKFKDKGEDVAKILAAIPEKERNIYAREIAAAIDAQKSQEDFNAILEVMTDGDKLLHGNTLNKAREKMAITTVIESEEITNPEVIIGDFDGARSRLKQNSFNDEDITLIRKMIIKGQVGLDRDEDVAKIIQDIPPAKLHLFKEVILEFIKTKDEQKFKQDNRLVFLEIADGKQARAEILKMEPPNDILIDAIKGGYYNAVLKIAQYGNVQITVDQEIIKSNGWKKLRGATANDKLRQMIYDKIPDDQRNLEDFTGKASPLFLAIKYKQYDFALALIDKGHELKNNKEIAEYNKENTNINQKRIFDRLTGKDKARLEQIKQDLIKARDNTTNTSIAAGPKKESSIEL